jgi:hypothetical protein
LNRFFLTFLFSQIPLGTKSLLKWKGVMFTADDDDGNVSNQHEDNSEYEKATPIDDLSSSTATNCTNSTPNTVLDSNFYTYTMDNEGNKVGRIFLFFINFFFSFIFLRFSFLLLFPKHLCIFFFCAFDENFITSSFLL